MQIRANGGGLEMMLNYGGTMFVCAYIGVDGLAGDLGEGERFTTHDGCVVTRRGDEAVWWMPPKAG